MTLQEWAQLKIGDMVKFGESTNEFKVVSLENGHKIKADLVLHGKRVARYIFLYQDIELVSTKTFNRLNLIE